MRKAKGSTRGSELGEGERVQGHIETESQKIDRRSLDRQGGKCSKQKAQHCSSTVFTEHLLCTKHYSRLDFAGAYMLMEIIPNERNKYRIACAKALRLKKTVVHMERIVAGVS